MKTDHEDNSEIDRLHIPHIEYLHWISNDTGKQSSYDKSTRTFGVRFFLRDLRANTPWVYTTVEEEVSQTILHDNEKMGVWFEKNKDNGLLESILVECGASGSLEAFKKCIDYILSILSTLCFFYRRPFRINKIKIYDNQHQAVFYTENFCPKPVKFISPLASFKISPLGSLLALYREGMNSLDVGYRYICFFKIYEAWQKKSRVFFSKKSKKPHLVITKNLLAGAYRDAHHKVFLDNSFNNSATYETLEKTRDYLVHPIIDKGTPPAGLHFDSIEYNEFMESQANLIERMVTKILEIELKLMAENDKEIESLLKIYSFEQIN